MKKRVMISGALLIAALPISSPGTMPYLASREYGPAPDRMPPPASLEWAPEIPPRHQVPVLLVRDTFR